ncbi:hypothetical protein [Flavobacterium sp. FlaQc-50]|uniref:hypothetical protein n=1 Tax=unclassified Flavobacterium TaxID=196869 RepID=UPI0037583CF0
MDVESLDAFEITMYNEYLRKMSKSEALQIIINNVEGDYTQLSDSLAEIAQEQNNE